MIIEKMELTNFKGCKNAVFEFGERVTNVLGENGSGKTTIATAFYWLFSNSDYDLHNNPPIFPLDVEECTPTIRIWLNVDGKTVEVAKIQKRTVKKSKTGGADTISLSNSYEVNSVEYGERDFKKKMQEYGFDFDLFLPLSHPEVFTSQKAVDMRKVLFSMESEKSDKEIADMTENVKEVEELLANYTADEVKAMQNATLRKIKEDYGKDGEILRAKIEGLETAKEDIDVAELELHRNLLKEQIADIETKEADISKQYEEQQRASDGILELQFELNDLQRKANEENNFKRRKIQEKIDHEKYMVSPLERNIAEIEQEISMSEKRIEHQTKRLNEMRDKYTEIQNLEFDESRLVCSYCGNEYKEDKKEEIKRDFKNKKAEDLSTITASGEHAKDSVIEEKQNLIRLKNELSENKKSLERINAEIAELEKELSVLPQSIDISDTEEVKAIKQQIAEKEVAMSKGNTADEIRQQLRSDKAEKQEELTEVEKQIAKSENNVRIDEQIEQLRCKQGEYEQSKADCERIIDQLDMVSRKKNELLTDEINRNFDIVRWQLFEYQKNGEYKDCCVPLIDGKRFGESTNTGREVLAKLDIIKGLQRFYGQNYPIFLDGAECLSEETKKRIDMDCQIIYLAVSEDKELRIETEV